MGRMLLRREAAPQRGEDSPPSPANQEDIGDPIAAQVIDNFSSHWEKFKEGMAKDLKSLVTTVHHPKTGLVERVGELEKEVDTLKKSHPPPLLLQDRLQLSSSRTSANSM